MKISYLTSCKNRTHHLKKTYIHNIKHLLNDDVETEFVLLNYNSQDDLDEWKKSKLNSLHINLKYLVTRKPRYFNMSHAKNILGKCATGDVLCWVDADNFCNKGFSEFIYQQFTQNINSLMKVSWSEKTSGMGGRIVCSKKNFMKIRGYNESFTGWGYEEVDFCERLQRFNIETQEIPFEFLGKINHTDTERFANYESKNVVALKNDDKYSAMRYESNYKNFMQSKQNIKNHKLVANLKPNWGEL